MKFKTVIIAGAIVAWMVSAASAKDWMGDCAKAADAWKAAYNAKDADALVAMYEPKKGTYSNMFWTATGHDVLAQSFKQDLTMGTTFTSIKCETSNARGDGVESKGTWSATAKGPDGKDMAMTGHWQTFGVEQNGKYLIVDHTGNMQLPPPK